MHVSGCTEGWYVSAVNSVFFDTWVVRAEVDMWKLQMNFSRLENGGDVFFIMLVFFSSWGSFLPLDYAESPE